MLQQNKPADLVAEREPGTSSLLADVGNMVRQHVMEQQSLVLSQMVQSARLVEPRLVPFSDGSVAGDWHSFSRMEQGCWQDDAGELGRKGLHEIGGTAGPAALMAASCPSPG